MMLDQFDRRILAILQVDGRIQNKELADQVGLSPSPCLRRVRRLEQAGVIERYVAVVAGDKVGFSLTIFVNVKLTFQNHQSVERFETEIRKYDNVIECRLMAGSSDYMLRLVVRDIAEYERFLVNKLTKIESVSQVESFISLKTVKQSTMLPII